MICYLDFDDFYVGNTGIEYLNELAGYFDNFKVNLFAVPASIHQEIPGMMDKKHYSLCIHGWAHKHWEVLSGTQLLYCLGKGFDRVYRAPYWQLTDTMYEKLAKLKFKIMLNPEAEDDREGIRFNWNLKDDPDLTKKVLMGHGHIQNTNGNGIGESFDRIVKLPRDTDFRFLKNYK